jgi:hypothetical protein
MLFQNLVTTYQTTRNPEDHNLYPHCHENLKPY